MSFTNWAKTYSATPAVAYFPHTLDAVVAAVLETRARGGTLRVTGALCSPNACAMNDGDAMLSLRHLQAVHSIDPATGAVDVDAGITLAALSVILDAAGLALPNLSSIADQTIGGSIATGTHGTGIGLGVLATCISRVTLVRADGVIVTACADDEDTLLFRGALCSLGVLGVVVRVTLNAVPKFDLSSEEAPSTLDDVLCNLPARIHSAPFYRFWWFPHTERVWEWRARAVRPASADARAITRGLGLRGFLSRLVSWLDRTLLEAALWVASYVPALVPRINAAWGAVRFSTPRSQCVRSDRGFVFDCLFSQHVDEWAIPVEALPEAMRALRALLSDGSGGVRGHFPVEVRFTAGDDILLSPSHGRASAWIGIIAYRPYGAPSRQHEAYFARFEEIMTGLGGRPHWAKVFGCSTPQLRGMYPQWDAFARLRAQLDPLGLFMNPWARGALLGDEKRAP